MTGTLLQDMQKTELIEDKIKVIYSLLSIKSVTKIKLQFFGHDPKLKGSRNNSLFSRFNTLSDENPVWGKESEST